MSDQPQPPVEARHKDWASARYNALAAIHSRVNCHYEHTRYLAQELARFEQSLTTVPTEHAAAHRIAATMGMKFVPHDAAPTGERREAGKMELVPLLWKSYGQQGLQAISPVGEWWCGQDGSVFGLSDTFWASSEGKRREEGFAGNPVFARDLPTLEAAKDACEDDYRRRVSAILALPAEPASTGAAEGKSIHVQWSDDGRFIRKWSFTPFEGTAAIFKADYLIAESLAARAPNYTPKADQPRAEAGEIGLAELAAEQCYCHPLGRKFGGSLACAPCRARQALPQESPR